MRSTRSSDLTLSFDDLNRSVEDTELPLLVRHGFERNSLDIREALQANELVAIVGHDPTLSGRPTVTGRGYQSARARDRPPLVGARPALPQPKGASDLAVSTPIPEARPSDNGAPAGQVDVGQHVQLGVLVRGTGIHRTT
jgi:hypothetical protein